MIRNQWYVVLSSRQVPRRSPVGVTRLGERLVFWRDVRGAVVCLRDQCAHRGAALSGGSVLDGGHLQCPFHGFEYDPSGRVVSIPANGRAAPVAERYRVAGYPTYEAHGLIWIWWGDGSPVSVEPAPPDFFDDLPDGAFYSATLVDPWEAHYARVIENQLDVVHLPFVHHNTIGAGGRTLVDGPVFRWQNEAQTRFRIYASNRRDDGTPPRSADHLDITGREQWLEFIFPNLWQNRISSDVRILAAFVPVDDEHTLLYLRFYQRFLRVPLLGHLVAWLSLPFNRLVAHQDRRVVTTQRPRRPELRGDEQLIAGDRPVVAYRRRRQALIDEAEGGSTHDQ